MKREASSESRLLEHGSSTLLADLNDTLTTKAGSVFCLCARDGDLDVGVNGSHGLYFHDTRFLEHATLRVDGQPLTVLLSSAVEDDRSVCELTNPDLELADGTVLPKERLSIRRERALGREVVETIEVRNFGPEPVGCRLDLEFATSFDDMFVIRGAAVGKRGRLHRPAWTRGGLRLRYDGADKRTRTTLIGFAPPPSARGPGGVATYKLALEAGEGATVRVTLSLEDQGPGALETKPVSSHRGEASFATVSVKSDNELFDQVLARSFEDLRMLATRERGETFFAAGVPWFVCLFGRDSLVTALQTLAYDAGVAAVTLLLLAKYQGRRHDEWRDE